MAEHKWSEEEKVVLESVFSSCTKDELCKTFPNRHYSSIMAAGHRLGLSRNNDFTLEEERIIREHYPSSPELVLRQLLPNRGWHTIRGKAQKLGIRRTFAIVPWTEEEELTLREAYPVLTKK